MEVKATAKVKRDFMTVKASGARVFELTGRLSAVTQATNYIQGRIHTAAPLSYCFSLISSLSIKDAGYFYPAERDAAVI